MAKAKNRRKAKSTKVVELGREGTPARFIREQYLAGKGTGEIFKAAKKRFPRNKIKTPAYVSWYGTQLRKKGLLQAAE